MSDDVCMGLWNVGSAVLREHAPKTKRFDNGIEPFWPSKEACAAHVAKQTTCDRWELIVDGSATAPTITDGALSKKLVAATMMEPGHRFLTISNDGKCAGMALDAVVCGDGQCFRRSANAYEGVQVQCDHTTHKGYGCTCDGVTLLDGVNGGGLTFQTCRFDGWKSHSGWDDKYTAPVKYVTPPPVARNWNRLSPDMAAEAVVDAATSVVESGQTLEDKSIKVHRGPNGEYVAKAFTDPYNKPCHKDADCAGLSPYCVKERHCYYVDRPVGYCGAYSACQYQRVLQCDYSNGKCKNCRHNNGKECKDPFSSQPYVCQWPGEDGKGAGKCTTHPFTGNLGQKCSEDADCGGNASMCRDGVCKACDKNNGTECGTFVCDTAKFVCTKDQIFKDNIGDKCKVDGDCGGLAKYCHESKCKQCKINNKTECGNNVCDVAAGRCKSDVFEGNIGEPCKHTSDCAGEAKYCINGKCVACYIDNGRQCANKKVCNIPSGKCTEVDFTGNYGHGCAKSPTDTTPDNDKCGGTSPVCDYVPARFINMCVECKNGDTSRCEGGNCRYDVGKCVTLKK